MVQWIKSCMQKIMVITQEMRKRYTFRAFFERDRQTDIVSYGGAVCKQKGYPRKIACP